MRVGVTGCTQPPKDPIFAHAEHAQKHVTPCRPESSSVFRPWSGKDLLHGDVPMLDADGRLAVRKPAHVSGGEEPLVSGNLRGIQSLLWHAGRQHEGKSIMKDGTRNHQHSACSAQSRGEATSTHWTDGTKFPASNLATRFSSRFLSLLCLWVRCTRPRARA